MHTSFLTLSFLYSLFLAIVLPILLPGMKVIVFAPFIILAMGRCTLQLLLLLALLCGLVTDLLTANDRFGIFAASFVVTALLLNPWRHFFFPDKAIALPAMAALFTTTSSLITPLIVALFGLNAHFSLYWLRSALVDLPFYELIYTAIAFNFLPRFFPLKSKRTPQTLKFDRG